MPHVKHRPTQNTHYHATWLFPFHCCFYKLSSVQTNTYRAIWLLCMLNFQDHKEGLSNNTAMPHSDPAPGYLYNQTPANNTGSDSPFFLWAWITLTASQVLINAFFSIILPSHLKQKTFWEGKSKKNYFYLLVFPPKEVMMYICEKSLKNNWSGRKFWAGI